MPCQSGVWAQNGRSTIERHVWYATENEDYRDAYGDMCNADLWARGWGQQSWVVTGADACSEVGKQRTSDGVLCFAIRLRSLVRSIAEVLITLCRSSPTFCQHLLGQIVGDTGSIEILD